MSCPPKILTFGEVWSLSKLLTWHVWIQLFLDLVQNHSILWETWRLILERFPTSIRWSALYIYWRIITDWGIQYTIDQNQSTLLFIPKTYLFQPPDVQRPSDEIRWCSRWPFRCYNNPVEHLPDESCRRCLWVYRMKNEHPIGLVDLLVGLTIRIFLCCILRSCAASDDLAVLVCYPNRCILFKKAKGT